MAHANRNACAWNWLGLLVAVALGAMACASLDESPPDIEGLALARGVDERDLALFLAGYRDGYEQGVMRGAGMRAGVGVGGGSGVEGEGWQLGFQDAMNGRPEQDPEALADRLASGP